MKAWLYKLNVVYTWNAMLFSLKKEGNPDMYNMDEPWEHYAQWYKPATKGQILCESTYMRYWD